MTSSAGVRRSLMEAVCAFTENMVSGVGNPPLKTLTSAPRRELRATKRPAHRPAAEEAGATKHAPRARRAHSPASRTGRVRRPPAGAPPNSLPTNAASAPRAPETARSRAQVVRARRLPRAVEVTADEQRERRQRRQDIRNQLRARRREKREHQHRLQRQERLVAVLAARAPCAWPGGARTPARDERDPRQHAEDQRRKEGPPRLMASVRRGRCGVW